MFVNFASKFRILGSFCVKFCALFGFAAIPALWLDGCGESWRACGAASEKRSLAVCGLLYNRQMCLSKPVVIAFRPEAVLAGIPPRNSSGILTPLRRFRGLTACRKGENDVKTAF